MKSHNRFTNTQLRLLAAAFYGQTPADVLDAYPSEVLPQPPDAALRLIRRGLMSTEWTITDAGRAVCEWLFEADQDSDAMPKTRSHFDTLRPIDAWIAAERLLPDAVQDLLYARLRRMHSTFPRLKSDDVPGRARAWQELRARKRGTSPEIVDVRFPVITRNCEVCDKPFRTVGGPQHMVCGSECRAAKHRAYMRYYRWCKKKHIVPNKDWKYDPSLHGLDGRLGRGGRAEHDDF